MNGLAAIALPICGRAPMPAPYGAANLAYGEPATAPPKGATAVKETRERSVSRLTAWAERVEPVFNTAAAGGILAGAVGAAVILTSTRALGWAGATIAGLAIAAAFAGGLRILALRNRRRGGGTGEAAPAEGDRGPVIRVRRTRTLAYYDMPQIFEARDDEGGRYLATAGAGDEVMYLVVKMARGRLDEFTSGRSDHRSIIDGTDRRDWYTTTAIPDEDPEGTVPLVPWDGTLPEERFMPPAGFKIETQ